MDCMEYIKQESLKFGMFNNPVRISEDYIEITYCGNMNDRVRRYLDFLTSESEKDNISYMLERPVSTNYAGRKFSWYKIHIKIKNKNNTFTPDPEF